ncbi:MAG: hypothetical protein AAGI92_08080 [Pseudomonadota bacterium]
MLALIRAALLASVVIVTAPALAQSEDGQAIALMRATSPDVHALRYYARLGDTERYQLELKRLQAMYPGFTPPSNLTEDEFNSEQELWDLYADGRFADIRQRIVEIQETNPAWQPSKALVRELNRVTKRGELLKAFSEFDSLEVKRIANDNPLLINPDDPEVVWAVAETFALEKDIDAAIEAFTFAVTTAQTEEVKAGALQKAAQHLPLGDSSPLYTLAKIKYAPEKIDETLDLGYARGLVIRSNQYGVGFSEDYIEIINLFMQRALAEGWLDDIEVLSWTLYNQGQYLPALALFQRSLQLQPDEKTVEGLLLSLKLLNRAAEARPIATEWRTASRDIAKLYLNLWAPVLLDQNAGKLESEFLRVYAQTTNEVISGEGAEALGWYAFNVQQLPAADAWFRQAIEWELTETAVLGRLLTAASLKDKPTFDRLQATYSAQYPDLALQKYEPEFRIARQSAPRRRSQTRSQTFSNRIAAAHKAKKFRECVSLSDQQLRAGRMTHNDYQIRGWCLLELKRPAEAQESFEMALSKGGGSTTKDRQASGYGASLAALRRGRTDTAFDLANENTLEKGQRRVVNKEILTQRSISAFRNRDYRATLFSLNELRKIAPEPRDLAQLRGWSLYYLGDYRGSLRVFEALDSIYSTTDTKRALQTVRARAGRG